MWFLFHVLKSLLVINAIGSACWFCGGVIVVVYVPWFYASSTVIFCGWLTKYQQSETAAELCLNFNLIWKASCWTFPETSLHIWPYEPLPTWQTDVTCFAKSRSLQIFICILASIPQPIKSQSAKGKPQALFAKICKNPTYPETLNPPF